MVLIVVMETSEQSVSLSAMPRCFRHRLGCDKNNLFISDHGFHTNNIVTIHLFWLIFFRLSFSVFFYIFFLFLSAVLFATRS
ncbi:hypothetical protein Hanom_Chr00s212915g01841101 [Helianthus anomalus]